MDSMSDNGQATPALSLTDIDSTINGEPRILDLRLAEVLGFKKPRDIRPLIERHREALERFAEVCRTVRQTSTKGGRPTAEFWLTKKQAIYITTKAETERATDITIAVVEVFDQASAGRASDPITDAIVQRLRNLPTDERERILNAPPSTPLALPPPAPEPPFCTGCAAKQRWQLGGFNQSNHPLRHRPLDHTDLEILRATRERIDTEIKNQLANRLDKALAAARLTLTASDEGTTT